MIAANSATALTTALEAMEEHAVGLAAAIAAYDAAFNAEHRRTYQQGGLNRLEEIDAAFGPRARDQVLAARLRGLQVLGIFQAPRSPGVIGEAWAERLIANIKAAVAAAA